MPYQDQLLALALVWCWHLIDNPSQRFGSCPTLREWLYDHITRMKEHCEFSHKIGQTWIGAIHTSTDPRIYMEAPIDVVR